VSAPAEHAIPPPPASQIPFTALLATTPCPATITISDSCEACEARAQNLRHAQLALLARHARVTFETGPRARWPILRNVHTYMIHLHACEAVCYISKLHMLSSASCHRVAGQTHRRPAGQTADLAFLRYCKLASFLEKDQTLESAVCMSGVCRLWAGLYLSYFLDYCMLTNTPALIVDCMARRKLMMGPLTHGARSVRSDD